MQGVQINRQTRPFSMCPAIAIPEGFKALLWQWQFIPDFRWSTSPRSRKIGVGKHG